MAKIQKIQKLKQRIHSCNGGTTIFFVYSDYYGQDRTATVDSGNSFKLVNFKYCPECGEKLYEYEPAEITD